MYTNIHVFFKSDLGDRCLLLKTDFLFKALAKKKVLKIIIILEILRTYWNIMETYSLGEKSWWGMTPYFVHTLVNGSLRLFRTYWSFSFLIKTSSLYTHRSLKQTKCTHFTCISHTPSQACKSGHERTASSYISIILSLFYYFFTVLRGRKSQQKTNNQTGQSAEMSQIPKAVNRKYMY